jgi:hypothetical protein
MPLALQVLIAVLVVTVVAAVIAVLIDNSAASKEPWENQS